MRVRKNTFYPVLYSLLALVISMWLVPLYIDGDQYHYIRFYENCILNNYSLNDKFICYTNHLDSKEPGYFLIMYFFGMFLSKNTIIFAANTILTFVILKLIFINLKREIDKHILSFFLLSNFYVLVLFLSAERLKFSFILLFIALLVTSKNAKILFSFLSLMTHSQNLILFTAGILTKVKQISLSLWKKVILLLGGVLTLLTVFYINKEHIVRKYTIYSNIEGETTGVYAVAKISILYFLTIFSVRKWSVIIGGLPILVSSYIIGSNRVMILMFVYYLIAVLNEKRKIDFIMLVVLSYFSYKSLGFIQNIILYGEGFNIL